MAMALLRGVEAWLVAYCLLLVGGVDVCNNRGRRGSGGGGGGGGGGGARQGHSEVEGGLGTKGRI